MGTRGHHFDSPPAAPLLTPPMCLLRHPSSWLGLARLLRHLCSCHSMGMGALEALPTIATGATATAAPGELGMYGSHFKSCIHCAHCSKTSQSGRGVRQAQEEAPPPALWPQQAQRLQQQQPTALCFIAARLLRQPPSSRSHKVQYICTTIHWQVEYSEICTVL